MQAIFLHSFLPKFKLLYITGHAKSGGLVLRFAIELTSRFQKRQKLQKYLNTNEVSSQEAPCMTKVVTCQNPASMGNLGSCSVPSSLFLSDGAVLSQLPWDATNRCHDWGLYDLQLNSTSTLLHSIRNFMLEFQGEKNFFLSVTYRMSPILLKNCHEEVIRTSRTEDTCLWQLDVLWTG